MPSPAIPSLFTPVRVGPIELQNRIVMASMTRGRASNVGLVPTPLHVEYYRQRASAGFLMSEAVWVSQRAIGFVNVPGLFTSQQLAGWRAVTDAVHAEGGRIFAQLAHSGAVSHPDFFDGDLPLAPSAINPGLRSFTPGGFKDTVTPRAMSTEEIHATVDDYRIAARNAKLAGFDGVELHCATTYLLPEFLNSALNRRTDAYGGNAANRARIVFEVLEAMIAEWGPGRVGIKLAPTFAMGGFGPTHETPSTYDHLVDGLNGLPLSHLQIVRARENLHGTPVAALQDTVAYYRARFRGTLIANGGFDRNVADAAVCSEAADLVSFATPFIGNPDLVERLRHELPLSPSDSKTYYQGGARGYIDYPLAERDRSAGTRHLTPVSAMPNAYQGAMMMESTPGLAPSHVVRADAGKRFDVLGAHLVWKARGEDTENTFTVAVQSLSARESIPRHQHRYAEVFYILSGEVEFTLFDGPNANTYTLSAGDSVMVAASSDHGVRNATKEQATLLDIASVSHQHFFDTVQREAPQWSALTPEETLHRIGEIGRKHTLEFWQPE